MDISQRVQEILMARNRAQAKAGDVMVSVMTLPAVLGLLLVYLAQDPLISQSLQRWPGADGHRRGDADDGGRIFYSAFDGPGGCMTSL